MLLGKIRIKIPFKEGETMFRKRIALTVLFLIGMLVIISSCGTENDESENTDEDESVIPSHVDYKDEDVTQIVKPQNELGFKLLPMVHPDENNNVFMSPTSLFMALSMVYNGADGATKEEIANTLQSENIGIEDLNKANAALLENLHDKSKSELNIANSIWLNDEFALDDDFKENTSDYFNAKVQEINIGDANAADDINDWVEQATNEKITDMVDSPLSQDLVAMLINAIYFKGDWKYEFNSDLTETHDFQTSDGDTKQVPLMQLEEELNYMENDKFQAVELPYTDNETSMHIFLPKEDSSLEDFTESLTLDQWETWQEDFTETEGTLMLPKFELEYEVDLNDPLTELGMKTAFDTEEANFPNISMGDEQIFISDVKQKSYVKVNEEGTEAAAATETDMEVTSFNPDTFDMIVDRPFFFTITDNDTGTILFMGSMANPPEVKE